MSRIRRIFGGSGDQVLVAGPKGGGGIVMKPQAPPVVESGGDVGCVDGNYDPQWVADSNGLYFAGTTISFDEAAYTGTQPPVYGGLFDLSMTPADRAIVCCNVEWNVVIDTGGGVGDFGYVIVGGLIIINYAFMEAGTMQMTATPTVCGEALTPLVYNWSNLQ